MHTSSNGAPNKLSPNIPILLAAYFLLSGLVLLMDIGQTALGGLVAEFGGALIPSIAGTAEIAPQPNNAAMVLVFAWGTGVALGVLGTRSLLSESTLNRGTEGRPKLSPVYKFGLPVLLLALLFVLATVPPAHSGGGYSGAS